MKIYVIHAYKYGDRERHSYQVGATTDPDLAVVIAINEEVERGGKYECEIIEWEDGNSKPGNILKHP